MINSFIIDIVDESTKNLDTNKIKTYNDIANCGSEIIVLSEYMKEQMNKIRSFLLANMYQSKLILDHSNYADEVINGLFFFYKENLNKLPVKIKLQKDNPQIINRAICDFISGMTDNYADEQYKEHLK